jgi:hypothetical protein
MKFHEKQAAGCGLFFDISVANRKEYGMIKKKSWRDLYAGLYPNCLCSA